MKSFKLYSLQEAQTKAAMEMEMLIVSAAGGPKYVPKDKKISRDSRFQKKNFYTKSINISL